MFVCEQLSEHNSSPKFTTMFVFIRNKYHWIFGYQGQRSSELCVHMDQSQVYIYIIEHVCYLCVYFFQESAYFLITGGKVWKWKWKKMCIFEHTLN